MAFLGRVERVVARDANRPLAIDRVGASKFKKPPTLSAVKSPALMWYRAVLVVLSIGSLVAYVVLGLAYIPLEHLAAFDQYDRSLVVLKSIGVRLGMAPAFTLSVWLAPLLLAPFLPLDVLTGVFRILSYAVGIVMVGSLLSYEERLRVGNMLDTMPALGYMWHDTILILTCCLIVQPERPLLILLGPGAAICGGETTTRRPAALFVALGLVSIATVLPTAYAFVNPDTGEMFIAGYSTDSVFGTMLSYSVVLSFTRAYHLMARSAYRTGLKWASCVGWIVAFVWLLFGSAFVELWVSSAYAFYLAFTSCTRLDAEPESVLVRVLRRKCRVRSKNSQIPAYVK